MWPEIVNTGGLIANIAGVALAFFYGYPQPSHEGMELMAWGDDPAAPALKAKYLLWSRVGLGLMAAGFVLQLIATWIARVS